MWDLSKSPATWWLWPIGLPQLGLSWDPQNLYRNAAPRWGPVTNVPSACLSKLLSGWFPRSSTGHTVSEVCAGLLLPDEEKSPRALHCWNCSVSASSSMAALPALATGLVWLKLKFHRVLINLNLSSCMWPEATVLDSTDADPPPQSLSSTVLPHTSHIHIFHSQPSLGQALLIQCSPFPHTSTSTHTDSKGISEWFRESFHLLMDEWKVRDGLLGWEVLKPSLLENKFALWLS